MEETLGNLSAFYAMFPGNHKFNVFPLWLAEDHHARLSSVFAPHIGHPHSEDLDSEYLNIFETRTRTPFFQDVYVDGVRVMLIIGPTGTGKSVHGNRSSRSNRSTAGSPTSSTSAAAMRVSSSCTAGG
jgi:type IV secretion system protein VirB4